MKFALTMAFADPLEHVAMAQVAEECGYWGATLPDHLVFPEKLSAPYPYTEDGVPRFTADDPFPDPWICIAAMAQATTTLQFTTNVFVMPARNPVHTAKTLGTLGVISNNRVAMGIGMGWMPEEFAMAEQPFAKRGKRADEMIEVMKKLWTGDWVEHHGEFYDFDKVKMRPAPTQTVPIYVGGFSAPAMRRAARQDGWIADLHSTAELEALMKQLHQYREDAGNTAEDYQIMSFGCTDAFTPEGFGNMRDLGVTVCTVMPWVFYGHGLNAPLEDRLDGIRRFADDIIGAV